MRNSFKFNTWRGITLVCLALTIGCASKDDDSTSGKAGTIEGTWSGVINDTYYCESAPDTIEFNITASTITISAGTAFAVDTTGTITQQDGQAYTVTVNNGSTDLQGQLFVDPAINYALLTMYSSANGNAGYVGVMQKGALSNTTYQETDLIGEWLGVAVRVNANFEVTESTVSSMTIS